MRRDLADVRLANRVFAPHYAAPMPCHVNEATMMRSAPAADSEILVELAAGETFEVLELAGGNAWGVAPAHKLVGYIAAASLGDSQ